MEKNSQISLQKKTMMESEETALTTECLQILQGKPITGERHMFGFELDTNYERRSVFYQLKRIVRMWANRLYFWLAPESQDPRWIPGNYTIEYCKSPPIAMILLAILAIILFLIDDCRGLLDNTSNPNSIAYYLVYKPERRYQLWRYFTTLFVHTDWSHLGSNLILQIVFGIQLEVAHGWRRVLLVNMPGVLAGTLASSITSPEAKLAGASAGVYCLITFHLICIIVKWSELEAAAVKLIIDVILITLSVVSSLYNTYVLNIDTVSDSAHVGGALTGLLLGLFILRNFQSTKMKTIIGWLCLVVYLILIGAAIVWHLLCPNYFPQEL